MANARAASVKRVRGDKRRGQRASVTVEVSIQGTSDTYSAQTVDISRTGALLWITDEKFLANGDAANMVLYSERVAAELGDGMLIRFGSEGVERQAEVVRVTRKGLSDSSPMLVGCRFAEILEDDDFGRIGIPVPEQVATASRIPLNDESKPRSPQRDERPPPGVDERRAGKRVNGVLVVEVKGDYGTYQATALNVSTTGVLLAITDPNFQLPDKPDQLVLFTKRLGFQFRNGLVIRFPENDVIVEAEMVRVSERTEDGELLVVIGASFRQPLSPGEWARIDSSHGDEPPRPPGRAPAPAKVAAPRQVQPPVIRRTGVSPQARVYELLQEAMAKNASDLHLKATSPARLRVCGRLVDVDEDVLSADQVHAMARELMSSAQLSRFETEGDIELTCAFESIGRFRVAVLRQRGQTSLAIRCIPPTVPSVETLGISELARTLANRPRGLVLVTGPTGSGKSHTLAAMVDHVNRTRECHILTMEDPIEFLHDDVKAHITQREIGRDCVDFARGLRRALRHDPDVILVGEMRDLETIALALTAAETGHLVFGTLHTASASQCPERIIDVFPGDQQQQIRLQLSESLQGIMSQILVPTERGGRVAVQEILLANDAVRSLIRESKTPQLYNILQTGGKEGMQTLETALNELVAAGIVSFEAAVAAANLPDQILQK